MRYPLAPVTPQRAAGWSLVQFAAVAGLHPLLVRRFVTLGLLIPEADADGGMWFPAAQLARVARIQRLRTGLGLNYAALGVVLDLLARIEDLEAALRSHPTNPHHGSHTSTGHTSEGRR
ncbi:MAG TPA: chaperone modulator CbpM [Pseudonocardiaceae bacterium]|nr:chaperone modulator CbpM [Pseudonocardiaceae bacterium]